MSRVDKMAAAASRPVVKFLEITRIYSRDNKTLICVFEGDDAQYYGCRLSSVFGDEAWQGVNTGGRDAVLEVRDLLLEHPVYKDCNSIYFIDHDYMDWFLNPDPDRVYVTPGYSVENLYVNELSYRNLLRSEFGLTEDNECSAAYFKALEIFRSRFSELCAHLFTFNVWAKASLIMRRDGKPSARVYLMDATAETLANIDLQQCTIAYDPANIKTVFKKSDESLFCQDALCEAHMYFSDVDQLKMYRGKQQLEFYRLFLVSLKEDYMQLGGVVFTKKGRRSLSFSKDTFMSEISQYAETPSCLRQFLESHRARMNTSAY